MYGMINATMAKNKMKTSNIFTFVGIGVVLPSTTGLKGLDKKLKKLIPSRVSHEYI